MIQNLYINRFDIRQSFNRAAFFRIIAFGAVVYITSHLNPDISSSEHYSLLKDGSLEIEIKRAKPSDQSITLIVYTEINRIREPSFDYQI